MLNTKRGLKIILAAGCLSASLPTSAINFNTGTDLGSCVGLNGTQFTCTSADNITITSAPGNLFTEAFRGTTGLGVTGGLNGEIDEGEAVFLTLDRPGIWHDLQFSRLFGLGAGDAGQEFANVQTSLAFLRGQLALNADNVSATWTLFLNDVPFSVRNAIAVHPFPGSGLFEVVDPFLTFGVSGLRLDADAPASFSNDFAFVAATVTPLPEPGSALLLLTAIAAITAQATRRAKRGSC